jgi:hypothetical protein
VWRAAVAIAWGSIADGRSADATSSLDSKTPAQTSIADPFDVTGTNTVQWNAQSAGIYHVYGHLDADQRVCDMSAYVRVRGAGPLAGTLNTASWIALGAQGQHDVAETRANGEVLPETDEPDASTSLADDTEAQPTATGEDKPAGQAD